MHILHLLAVQMRIKNLDRTKIWILVFFYIKPDVIYPFSFGNVESFSVQHQNLFFSFIYLFFFEIDPLKVNAVQCNLQVGGTDNVLVCNIRFERNR